MNDEIDAVSVEVMPGLAARIEELRGHTLAVVAVDPTGEIAGFSNRCGIAAAYCLAAPGQDIVVAYYGPAPPNDPDCPGCPEFEGVSTRHGTSYATPMVAGGLALMKQLFRSQLSNPDLAARLLATADRSGRYADKDVYGQGLLDLHAATSPVGVLEVPLPGGSTGLQETSLRLGAAFGDALEQSLAGREIAALDALGGPFWYSLGSFATAADGPSLAGELRELMAPAPDSRQDAERGTDLAAGRLVAAGRPPPRWRLGLFETPPAGARGGHLGLAGQALALDWTGDRGLSGTAFTTEGGIGRPAPASGTTLSWEPSGYPLRLRFGWMEERKTLLGTATEGAFGALAAGAVFAGVRTGAQLGGWRIGAEAEVGSVHPATGDGIVAGISPPRHQRVRPRREEGDRRRRHAEPFGLAAASRRARARLALRARRPHEFRRGGAKPEHGRSRPERPAGRRDGEVASAARRRRASPWHRRDPRTRPPRSRGPRRDPSRGLAPDLLMGVPATGGRRHALPFAEPCSGPVHYEEVAMPALSSEEIVTVVDGEESPRRGAPPPPGSQREPAPPGDVHLRLRPAGKGARPAPDPDQGHLPGLLRPRGGRGRRGRRVVRGVRGARGGRGARNLRHAPRAAVRLLL